MAIYQKFTSDDNIQLTVTSTATSLKALLVAAGENLSSNLDFAEVNTEGDIRYTLNGNTPTTTKGMKLASNKTLIVEGTPLDKILLIASANTLINVQVGFTSR